ncbi:alpha/beta hydrolase [Streptomyces sp. NPDC097619]|uniref:alpha/beta hydrolase n=1 Tax=Streptomyces sp. NPDC097619 TaxID=3157228 RepID=UPI0033310CD7
MTTYSKKTLVAVLTAATVAASLTGFAGVAGASSDAPRAGTGAAAGILPARAGQPAPVLDWQPCEKPGGPAGQECATLSVPLDHADPTGPRIEVAVSRIRAARLAGATRAPLGTLLVIPGGPGGSGVQRLTQKGDRLRATLGDAYDLVAMDPRGVGGSTTASCGLDPEDRRLLTLRSWPGPGGEVAENHARSRRTAEACARNGGAVLRSFTTANQVRDLDLLRAALGEERISAWGVSYGAYVAAVYAQEFPHRTDRWVLDSVGDPDPERLARGWLANMARGAEDRFPDFAAWAAHPDRDREGLRLAERPERVRPLVPALAAELDERPRPSDVPGIPLTGNGLRQALQNALYADAAFPAFARLVREARDPGATPALPPEPAGPMSDQAAAVMIGVICNDVTWPTGSVAGFRRAVAADRAAFPLTGGMPVNVTPCAFWKDRPEREPVRITDRGPGGILLVNSRRDPATPLAGALRMRAALGDRARTLVVEHGGHGMYLGNGNACGDRAVTAYLSSGRLPARDGVCPD